jgi:hypothetical protein
VTVSMRVMSAGDGYKYLLRTVATGDGDRVLSTPLTRYYTEEGTRRVAGSGQRHRARRRNDHRRRRGLRGAASTSDWQGRDPVTRKRSAARIGSIRP